jgi:hypothetical protein
MKFWHDSKQLIAMPQELCKMRQGFIDGRHNNRWATFPSTHGFFNSTNVNYPSLIIRPSIPPTSMLGPIEKPMTK